jgi:hypothetical protein
VRAEKPVQGSDQQSCHPGRLTVMITGHVPAVRLPPDHAGRGMAAASRREEAWRITEILILRHQLAVLQRRQPVRPKLNWADRALLAILLGVIPKARRHGLRLLVTPDTILRWHRDIIRRRWAARSIRGKTGRPATRRNIKTLILRLASTWASRASATIHAIRRSILASDGGCRRHPASARHPSGGRTRAGGRTRRLGRSFLSPRRRLGLHDGAGQAASANGRQPTWMMGEPWRARCSAA